MSGQLRDNWGWVMLRGVASILFGVLAIVAGDGSGPPERLRFPARPPRPPH